MSLETHLHIIDSFCMRPIGAKISKNNCENCMFWENAHCTIAPEEMEIIEEYRKKREQAFTKSVKCIFEEL